ncbi:hypothetical protein B1748_15990 [Paenibacillus sp. MY03]|nr:hypothetical protein B1748_15990 [Paenibacillus sp. MY03]
MRVFLTTQYLELAEYLAHRISILHEGRIIVSDTLSDLKQPFPSFERFNSMPIARTTIILVAIVISFRWTAGILS